MTQLTIRPMQLEDIPAIVSYWCEADAEDLERMGVKAANIPSPQLFHTNLLATCASAPTVATSSYLMWLIDGEAIGYTVLKRIVYGESGDMHLHMWKPAARGKGYGGILFCLAALDFYQRYQLKTIICEPRATNIMPNRMLQKIGFSLVKTYVGSSSDLSETCELNRYYIDPAVASNYVLQHASTALPMMPPQG